MGRGEEKGPEYENERRSVSKRSMRNVCVSEQDKHEKGLSVSNASVSVIEETEVEPWEWVVRVACKRDTAGLTGICSNKQRSSSRNSNSHSLRQEQKRRDIQQNKESVR